MTSVPLTQEQLTLIDDLRASPLSVPAAREHWKYSKLNDALRTMEKPIEPHGSEQSTGDSLREVAGLAETMLRDSTFCPATCEALHQQAGLRLHQLSGEATLDIGATDARLPNVVEVLPGQVGRINDLAASSSQWLICLVRRDASLHYSRLRTAGDSQEWSKLQIVLEAGAEASVQSFALASVFRRHDLTVDLVGERASFDFSGAATASDKNQLDLQTHVRHHAQNTVSKQRWHTIGQDKGRLSFRGRILIDKLCPGVDAGLTNKNLALGDGVTINTKPELEIYSDDVRCAHGATVGQLDEQSLFYLLSRGIDRAAAQRMLSEGFLRECAKDAWAESAVEQLTASLR